MRDLSVLPKRCSLFTLKYRSFALSILQSPRMLQNSRHFYALFSSSWVTCSVLAKIREFGVQRQQTWSHDIWIDFILLNVIMFVINATGACLKLCIEARVKFVQIIFGSNEISTWGEWEGFVAPFVIHGKYEQKLKVFSIFRHILMKISQFT